MSDDPESSRHSSDLPTSEEDMAGPSSSTWPSNANQDLKPELMATSNTARMREGNGEDLIERVCQPMEGDKSGVGTNPSFVKVKEVDEKNSLPGNRTDGRKMILYRDHIEGIAGEGPFTTKEWLQVEFGRKHGTTDWEPRRILGRTKDPKKKDEWVKRTVKPEAPKPSEESD